MSIIIKAPSSSGTQYTINPPQWGYSVTINLPLVITRTRAGSVLVYDRGSDYDYRILECTFLLSLSETNTLINLCKDAAKGRDANVDFIISSGCGFFPFGPDKGDDGTFRARILSVDAQASIGHPQDLFQTTLTCIFNGTYPSFSFPELKSEGSLTIGAVSGLRYPQNMHEQKNTYNITPVLTGNGTPYTIDKTSGDVYESSFDLSLNYPNMAKLINELSVTVRGAAVNIVSPANSYMFGRENSSTATYSCKMLQKEITITHNNYNDFSTNITFYRVS